ncbi:MAG TPA: twin-arginine translocase subunit TatC [Thermoplasmata archaeon]|nr:twin-arginine translocase subunit TatC [Thermoplasmata archaeon]HYB78254.1 twin-arginine translocase subunit TatC [Thermoplasmata archaeon]
MGDLDRILSVLGEVRRRLIRVAVVLAGIFGFLLFFELVPFRFSFFGGVVWFAYPWPSPFYNVTAQVFRAMVAWMLPSGVVLLNVGVGDSIFVQMEIGILLSVILGMPWIVHEVGAFLVPALRQNERGLLRQIGIPATALFAVGTFVGLCFLTPFTFRLLFRYVGAMGLAPVLGVQQFVTFALLYSLAFGVVFELPVFIYALTRLGVVRASAWRKHWRGAVLGSLVFGMVVTPDNSGITMLLIALPMFGLYLGGAYFAARWEGRGRQRDGPRALAGTG